MLTTEQRQRMTSVLGGSLSLTERRRRSSDASVRDPDDLAERVDRWAQSVADGDSEAFEAILGARGLGARDGSLSKSVPLRSVDELPWAAAFRDLLELGGGDAAATPLPEGVAPALESFVRAAAYRLDSVDGAQTRLLGVEVKSDLLGALAEALDRVAGPVLAAERSLSLNLQVGFEASVEAPWDLDRWIEVFESYPALARVIAIVVEDWWSASHEWMRRLQADRDRLADFFFDGESAGLVENVTALGDPHGAGRRVLVVTFVGGRKLVYKPRDLRSAEVFQRLLAEVNRWGATLDLPTRRVLTRDGYAWEEFVERRACNSRHEVSAFYERMGSSLRLLQLLGATDFHFENVIARGAHPVLVDLETLLVPSPSDVVGSSLVRDPAEDSPLGSGLLSHRVEVSGQTAVEIGAICAMRGDAAVRWNGEIVRPSDFTDEILAGYAAMDRALADRRAELREHPLLLELAEVPVRFVPRPTRIYVSLLKVSLEPRCLTDGVVRELELERLWKARLANPALPVELVQAEVDALLRSDIPRFEACARDRSLRTEHVEIDGFFETSAWSSFEDRVRRLGEAAVGDDLAIIRETLAGLARGF